jgi:hypothetical protein
LPAGCTQRELLRKIKQGQSRCANNGCWNIAMEQPLPRPPPCWNVPCKRTRNTAYAFWNISRSIRRFRVRVNAPNMRRRLHRNGPVFRPLPCARYAFQGGVHWRRAHPYSRLAREAFTRFAPLTRWWRAPPVMARAGAPRRVLSGCGLKLALWSFQRPRARGSRWRRLQMSALNRLTHAGGCVARWP